MFNSPVEHFFYFFVGSCPFFKKLKMKNQRFSVTKNNIGFFSFWQWKHRKKSKKLAELGLTMTEIDLKMNKKGGIFIKNRLEMSLTTRIYLPKYYISTYASMWMEEKSIESGYSPHSRGIYQISVKWSQNRWTWYHNDWNWPQNE